MAKKGQQVQLQVEVATDEEWEKLLQKDGLIVVDVYSDWCGPCLGMQANLKKIKLEVGGDMLQLAVAKSDGITALQRFRNRSEPTWMFISKGKMVNLMFGADAPNLTRLILEELKKEQAQKDGQATNRVPLEITELAEEEQVRYEAAESIERAIKEKEERKKAKEVLDRRTKECENILTNLPNYGVALIFPSAKAVYKDVLGEILEEAGLNINQTEKIHLNETLMEELCFFTNVYDEFPEDCLEELYELESLMLLFKVAATAAIENVDDAMLTMVYGHMKKPPGTKDSVAQKLLALEEVAEEETEEADQKSRRSVKSKKDLVGIWVPVNPQVRATALRMFFTKLSSDFTIPEPPPEPEHLAIIFPVQRRDEVWQIMNQFPEEIMQRGIFTSGDCDDTQLVAKSLKKLDKLAPSQKNETDKFVLQVSKQRSECILAFAQINPIYMSPNAKEGKNECAKFFPDDYDTGDEEEVEEEEEEEGLEGEEAEEKSQLDGGERQEEDEEMGELSDKAEGETSESKGVLLSERSVGSEMVAAEGAEMTESDAPTEEPAGIKLTEDILEELLYFSDLKFPAKTVEDFGSNRLSFALLFKRSNDTLTGNIDDVVLQMIYGNSRQRPGDDKSPALKLMKVWTESGKLRDWEDVTEEEMVEIEDRVLLGIWAPPNSLSKAMALKLLFPNISNPFKMPDLKEVPLHVAVAYDSYKAKDVFELSDKYPGKVLSFGYFSNDLPGDAKLLGKTTEKFEGRSTPLTYEEKIIIQLAKDDPQCFMDFMELNPSYMSHDVDIGVLDCAYFFPSGYNTPEVEIISYLKKKTKRKMKMGKFKATDLAQEGDTQSAVTGTEVDTSVADLNEDHNGEDVAGEETAIGDDANNESDDEDGEECDIEEGKQGEDDLESADKATSPVAEA